MDTTTPIATAEQSQRTAVVTVAVVFDDGVSRQIRLPERLTPEAACDLLMAVLWATDGELEDVPF